MGSFFGRIGRFAIRYRWLVLAGWAGAVCLAMLLLPSLGTATQVDTSSFLPASSPAELAAQLAAPLQGAASYTAVTVVVAGRSAESGRTARQALTAADLAAAGRLAGALARVPRVVSARVAGESADGHAVQLTVLARLAQAVGPAAQQQSALVGQLRQVIAATPLPAGLAAHTAGSTATRVDNNATTSSSGSSVQWFSILFVVVLLVTVFRSALAPLVAVVPAIAVVLIAERLTAVLAVHAGLNVSQIASLLLIVLVIGAGTDYALFLMFRVREQMRGGQPCHEAIVTSVARVGETITFSAGVLIAALGSLASATFSLYSGLAAPLAIAVGLMLIAGLTLLPALLAVLGPVAFWPSTVRAGAGTSGWWGTTCARIVRRPAVVLALGLVIFGGLAVLSGGYVAAGFGGPVSAPAGSDSAAGDAILAAHFPATTVNPTLIVLRLRTPAWTAAQAVATAERQVAASPLFTAVSGPFNPGGAALTPAAYARLYQEYGPPRSVVSPPPGLGRVYAASGTYVSADGLTVGFATQLAAGNATTTAAAREMPAVRELAGRAARTAGAAGYGVAGQPAFTYDIARLSDSDLRTVIPVAVLVITVLLALVMRSLVAPLYLIASVVLSYFAALGLIVLVFMRIFGQNGLTFILPFLLFVFLLALGEDYNILVMTRIREEARTLSLREAVGRALTVTGSTVTSAGLVLALTFGVLAVVGSGSAGAQNVAVIVDVGVGLALGVLMDTFLVRTLLVPSAVVLIGRWNWWPSRMWKGGAHE